MRTLTYTQTKDLINLSDRKSVETYINEENNYSDTYRIISEDDALKEVKNSYKCDLYMLGCFNASFIKDYISLDYEDINALQDSEQFEIVGKLIMNSGNFDDMMQCYIDTDGYCAALNSYYGNYEEYSGLDLIVYRAN